jgi:hypothetical protein
MNIKTSTIYIIAFPILSAIYLTINHFMTDSEGWLFGFVALLSLGLIYSIYNFERSLEKVYDSLYEVTHGKVKPKIQDKPVVPKQEKEITPPLNLIKEEKPEPNLDMIETELDRNLEQVEKLIKYFVEKLNLGIDITSIASALKGAGYSDQILEQTVNQLIVRKIIQLPSEEKQEVQETLPPEEEEEEPKPKPVKPKTNKKRTSNKKQDKEDYSEFEDETEN